jgi:hypothetical protein
MENTEGLEEPLSSVFAPAIILPTQYWALKRGAGLDGERKLMLAVLEDGIRCYLKNMNAKSRRQRILFFEVLDWMKPEGDDGPFSFDLLCHEFGMEGSRVRCALEMRLALAKQRGVPALRASSSGLGNLSAARDPGSGINSRQSGSSAGDREAAL